MELSGEDIFVNLAVALALGLIIGFERGWSLREEEEGKRFAGFRTFMLISFLGALSALLEVSGYRELVIVIAVALGAFLAGVVIRATDPTNQGITTVVAALLTFILGFFAGLGLIEIAAISAVVITVLLGLKREMHGWLHAIERRELDAAMKLLVISVLILPLLPNQGYGPWEALNPYKIWWMVVLISVISFVGYFAIKWARPERGLMMTALAGGLASSTAIAVSFARLGKETPELGRILSAGVVASSTVMLPRTFLIAVVIQPGLMQDLALVLAPPTVVGALFAWWLWKSEKGRTVNLSKVETTFSLGMPLKFGLALAVIMLLAAGAREFVGDQGLYAVAALGGLLDVAAVTLTAAEGIGAGLSHGIAVEAILIAILVNTFVKFGIVAVISGWAIARNEALAFAAVIATGAAAYLVFMS